MKRSGQRTLLRLSLFLASILAVQSLQADSLIMVRTHHPLATTLEKLKQAIREQGYSVARVDMVNIGLLGMGYTSSSYRAVFFGKGDEINRLAGKYPQLVPYLPPRIAVFSEGNSTLLVTIEPSTYYRELLPDAEETGIFRNWERDIVAILSRMTQWAGKP